MLASPLVVCILLLASEATASFSQTSQCKVGGQIGARFGGIEPNATIVFEDAKMERRAVSDRNGAYSVLLPSGVYDILIKRWSVLRYRRARISVSCPIDLTLNIYTLPECVSYGCRQTGYYFSAFNGWTKNRILNVLVAYYSRRKSGTKIEYIDAVLTYDKYTVFADKMIHDVKSKTFLAKGKVWIEEGNDRRYFDKLKITFQEDGLRFVNIP